MNPAEQLQSEIIFPKEPKDLDYANFIVNVMNITANSEPVCGVINIEDIDDVAQEISGGINEILSSKAGITTDWLSIDKNDEYFIVGNKSLRDDFSFMQNGRDMQLTGNSDDWHISGHAIPYDAQFGRDTAKWQVACDKVKFDFKSAIMSVYKINEKEFNFVVTKHYKIEECYREAILASVSEYCALKNG